MTWKPLLHVGMIACLLVSATGPSMAQSMRPVPPMGQPMAPVGQPVAPVYGPDYQSCNHIRDQRERQRCLNSPSQSPKNNDWGAAVGAGIIGLTLGAIIAGAAASAENNKARPQSDYERWLDYCRAKYRSFDAASGTFRGNDGRRYQCR